MLTELRIKNFAIIDDLNIKFSSGLIIFTGETGAGKSIIIDAVEALLGTRVDATMIRTGSEEAVIEGEFKIHPAVKEGIHSILQAEELLDDLDFVTLGREIRRQGRNIARVNGRSVSAGLLRSISDYLIDVHGQSEHLSLLRVKEHLRLLDSYANIFQPLKIYRGYFNQLRNVRRDLKSLRESERDAARRADMLGYQINEIESARLRPSEEDELRQERSRLANAETLASLCQEALYILDEGDPENRAVTELYGQVVEVLTSLSKTDQTQKDLLERAEEIFENLTDLARELSDYGEGIEFNPRRLEHVELRLDLIHNLKRKYGKTIEEVLSYAEKARMDLDEINHSEERIENLETEEKQLLNDLAKQGKVLSQMRHKAAAELCQVIEGELSQLHMDGAKFNVEFQTRPDEEGIEFGNEQKVVFDINGLETIQFLVAPNMGEGLKPLAKIASGGETSRLMLALKNALVQEDLTPTLIFDEIDQGIGGRVGTIVGEKLWNISKNHQVLCITHLPQLAAFGNQHFQVQKVVREGRTITRLEIMDGEKRVRELAQMLGGISEGTLQSAHELLSSVIQITSQKQSVQ